MSQNREEFLSAINEVIYCANATCGIMQENSFLPSELYEPIILSMIVKRIIDIIGNASKASSEKFLFRQISEELIFLQSQNSFLKSVFNNNINGHIQFNCAL